MTNSTEPTSASSVPQELLEHLADLLHTDQVLDDIADLRQKDQVLHDILAVDVWALAKTMDEFQPGFWAAFMRNRAEATRRFIEARNRRARQESSTRHPFFD